jgi:ELWxxDGT repeat protein
MLNLYLFNLTRRVVLPFLLMLIALPAFSQIRLVADLDPGLTGDEDDAPQTYRLHESDGHRAFFVAGSKQLWTSDGTAEGTHIVRELGTISELKVINGIAFLATFSEEEGTELWTSDGTREGTVLLKDIYPGHGGSAPANFLVVGNVLYFSANNKVNGRELWTSDGTLSGTVQVKDIQPGIAGSNPSNLTLSGNKIFFKATDGVTGHELWASDGSSAGTYLVKDIDPTPGLSSAPDYITDVNGSVFFSATAPGIGKQLWKSDGTNAGTVLVKILRGGGQSSNISQMVNVADKVFFQATDGIHGLELWRSDGTDAGTFMVKDITPGPGSNVSEINDPHMVELTNVNGKLFFVAVATDYQRLWVSDGSEAGTKPISDIFAVNFAFLEPGITEINGEAYFIAAGYNGINLFKSDGETVTVVKENAAANYTSDVQFREVDGKFLYISDQFYWTTDGTESGTGKLKWIGYPNHSLPEYLTDAGDLLYFQTYGQPSGIWKSDGTTSGTTKLSVSYAYELYGYNNLLFAWAGAGVLRSDGTTSGTFNLNTSLQGPQHFQGMNNKVYFGATTSAEGSELWQTDGTIAGTAIVKDINPGPNASTVPTSLTAVDNTLYFAGTAPGLGHELYKTDGTAAGTTLVKDINPGTGSSYIDKGIAFNGKLIFHANTDANGIEVWVSNGTAEGTIMLKDIRTNDPYTTIGNPDLSNLVANENFVFFTARNDAGKISLWRTNGTPAGTIKLRDYESTVILPLLGANSTHAIFLVQVSGAVELWKSNGTTTGTQRIRIFSDHGYSAWSKAAILNNVIYFNLASAGEGIWRTDGTVAGTYPIEFEGYGSELTASGGYVYFSGYSPYYGSELFLIDEASHSAVSARQGIAAETTEFTNDHVSGYPNPFNSNITLRVDGESDQTFTLNVITAKGEKISQSVEMKYNVDYALGQSWRSGMYVLQIVEHNKMTTKKVIKLND